MVPAGVELLAPDAALFGPFPFEQVECKPAQGREVLRRVACAGTALILPTSLKPHNIKYIHMPEIGGLRHPKRDSINLAWENSGFRGYADYMQTQEFTDNLLKIGALARENCLALMCAEALPWKCHRNLLSDALVVRHVKVEHIISKESTINHKLTEFAHVEGTKINYPLYTKETPQRTLGDFGS